MRNVLKFFAAASVFAASTIALFSCDGLKENGYGELVIDMEDYRKIRTRAVEEFPEVEDFLLSVKDSKGNVIYSGTFGDSPESLQVPSGSCYISARSCEFTKPKFSSPVYGDDVCVVVPSGKTVTASLVCTQVNAGIRLKIARTFLSAYPSGALLLKSSDGSLTYSFSEKRFAYFRPGNVSLILTENGTDTKLLTKELSPNELLTLNISVSEKPAEKSGISIEVDTTRIWSMEDYVIGGGESGGTDFDDAYTVEQAKDAIGEKDVWVKGYIVGGDLTASSSGISFQIPFSSRTNIAIASRSSVSSKSSCLAVSLPSGEIRDALNLVDRPELLGRMVYLKCEIVESYYGLVGLKNLTDYKLK